MALYLSAAWLSNSNQMGILQVNPDLHCIKQEVTTVSSILDYIPSDIYIY